MDYSTITPNSGPVSGAQNVEKPRPMPVVSEGDVVRREAGIGKKLYDAFFSASPKEVMAEVRKNVIKPSLKKLLLDFIFYSASTMINGKSTPQTPSIWNPYGGLTSVINYNAISSANRSTVISQSPPVPTPNGALSLDNIEFYDELKARRVMAEMNSYLNAYKIVAVSDYYDFCGIGNYDFMAKQWGWDNLDGMDVVLSGNMWKILLPPIRPIARR